MHKKRIKILTISHMFPSRMCPYLGNQIYERAIELEKKYDIRIIAPVPSVPKIFKKINPYYGFAEIPRQEKIGKILVYRPRYFTFPGMFLYFVDALTYYFAMAGLINKIYSDWQFDLIDAHQAFPDGFVATKIANKLSPKPKVVTTIHGADIYIRQSSFIQRSVILFAIKFSDLVIAVSNIVEKKLKLLSPSTNTVVIPIGVQLPTKLIEISLKTGYSLDNKFIILTAGDLIERKGQKYVLYAIKELSKKYKNVLCIILGSGPKLSELCNFVKANEIEKYVYFAGAVRNVEAHAYFEASDVFILPSWDESLGIVYMEAMAHGKPAIGCKGQGAEEIITDKVDGFLVEPRNTRQIVNNLEKLIINPSLRKRMGKAAKSRAESSFQFKDRIKETVVQFENLTRQKDLKNYKDAYIQKYYNEQGQRFDLSHHDIFSLYFDKFPIKQPILDLGCATGLFMQEAKSRKYEKVVGIDVSRYAIEKARKSGLDARLYDGKKVPFKDNSFNTIFCYQVIEHIPRSDANVLLKECYRVLKTGGRLLLFSPAGYAENYNTDPTHINFYPIEYFQKLIIDLGFKIYSFESTMYLPAVLRNIQPFSYIASKYLYRILKRSGTTIEMEAVKL